MLDYSGFAHMSGATIVSSYADGYETLSSENFLAGSFETESAPFKAETIFEVNGQVHQEHRRLAAPLFNRRAISLYETEILPGAIRESIEVCAIPDGAERRIDIVALTRRVMAHVAVSLLGLDVSNEMLEQLLDLADVIAMAVDVKWASGDHQEVISQGHVAVDEFIASMYEPAVLRHQRGSAPADAGPQRPDLIAQLLLRDEWDSALRLREALVYLSAGIRTTAHAVTRTFEALENWYEKDPTRARSIDGTFLRIACNEALRLNPPSPALLRESRADYTYESGRRVAKGERVAVDLVAANTDESVFGANAGEFDPSRSLPPRVPGYGLSFGAGQHTCIGKPLVTASGAGAGEGQLKRSAALLLLALYEHGVRRDPERAPSYAASAQDRYDSFPALLQMESVGV